MNKFKKIIAVAMTAVMAVSATAVAVSAAELQNDSLYFETTGTRFALRTVNSNGTPDVKLLYRGNNLVTSQNIVSVDGYKNAPFYTTYVSDDNTYVSSTAEINGVDLSETFSFSANSSNGEYNILKISVTATNNSDSTKKVGVRNFLDTYIDSDDYVPFRIAGYGPISSTTSFSGNNIPSSFQAFSSLTSTPIITRGFYDAGTGLPDTVNFTLYGWSNSITLHPSFTEGEAFGDSAVDSIWDEANLEAGDSKTYTVYYGIGEITVNENSELTVGATKSEQNFTINEEGTGYTPVSILGYLKNTGNSQLKNAEISIDVPNGVTVEGDTSFRYDTLNTNDETQDTWVLNAKPSGVDREVTVVITGTSDSISEQKTVSLTYTIPAIEGAPIE